MPANSLLRGGVLRRLTLAGLVGLAVAGCALSPQEAELANMAPWNIVPKTSPSQLVRAFDLYCLAPDIAAARAALRASDYVRARAREGTELYVVDDQKPAVLLHESVWDFDCVIIAEARTGQHNRVQSFVTETFPDARPADPARLGQRAELLWLAPGPRGGIIYVERSSPLTTPPGFSFGIIRPDTP